MHTNTHPAPPTADELAWASSTIGAVTEHFTDSVVGQDRLRTALLATVLARGHVLLESLPGMAKTLAASSLARSVAGSFTRVQCTPDLLPSDILGTQVFNPSTARFSTELGPVHVNFVLLDEINRSSAKTQSAMLEAMQERQTSIGGRTHPLPDPFVVLATQNPIEEEGTYVLPHAQLDRFLLKEVITHPSPEEELEVLERVDRLSVAEPAPAAVTTADVVRLQELTRRVHVSTAIRRYLVEIASVTRHPADHLPADKARWFEHGTSPRGTIAFQNVARAVALLDGRDHVVPDDVVSMRHPVLRHRLLLTYEALAARVDVDALIDVVFEQVPTP